ncbi:hypothetical protein Acr_07g0000530 [Actinidia rufa]|uniref:Uncharacterized protein n=1 Tax=Actinidia rufa TaxID=165716 RepID=A0A7J0EUG2_9ERIC|nr:hypothetical protein Acr_07g0000530 [Actinidia rufa]
MPLPSAPAVDPPLPGTPAPSISSTNGHSAAAISRDVLKGCVGALYWQSCSRDVAAFAGWSGSGHFWCSCV